MNPEIFINLSGKIPSRVPLIEDTKKRSDALNIDKISSVNFNVSFILLKSLSKNTHFALTTGLQELRDRG